MFEQLHAYLVKNKKLALPGLGTVSILYTPAKTDFPSRSILPPLWTVQFQQGNDAAARKLYTWLSQVFSISEREAVIRLNDFVYNLKKNIESGTVVEWSSVGTFKKTLSGISFEPQQPANFLQPVPAEKIIRENADQTMLVGEQEKTSTQMAEILHPAEEKRTMQWWIIPVAIVILVFIFTGWYISEHGMNLSATGNTQKIKPANPPSGFYFK
ncbi:MAG: hypothetical protein C4308_05780 [Chitinophagaceae bacterium]